MRNTEKFCIRFQLQLNFLIRFLFGRLKFIKDFTYYRADISGGTANKHSTSTGHHMKPDKLKSSVAQHQRLQVSMNTSTPEAIPPAPSALRSPVVPALNVVKTYRLSSAYEVQILIR
jgi:hypothetical protein